MTGLVMAWDDLGLGVHGALPLVEEKSGRKARLLVVEDDARLRSVMARLLRLEGYEVLEAGNGLEAMACLQGNAVDAVLTDLCMPVMDGGQLIALLEELHPEVPVVIVSGECDARERFQLHGRGNIFRFLLKPIAVGVLLEAVRETVVSRNFNLSKIDPTL